MDYLATPVYRSILHPKLVFGVPRGFFILLSTLTGVMVLSLSQYWFIGVFIALIAIFNPISKQEPFFFDLLTALLKLPEKDLD